MLRYVYAKIIVYLVCVWTQEVVGKLKLLPGEEVLDVGCGLGGAAFLMAQVRACVRQRPFNRLQSRRIAEFHSSKCYNVIIFHALEIIGFYSTEL